VVFNDIVSNDFNTLFKSLPSDRQYFVAGVPRRFQGRLFFKAFLRFVHSSYALLWLLNAPKELMDKNSHHFLAARAEELVDGGLMALVLDNISPSLQLPWKHNQSKGPENSLGRHWSVDL
ncbi:hypothetical protein POUND7_001688, partial [Theobroma cacao]